MILPQTPFKISVLLLLIVFLFISAPITAQKATINQDTYLFFDYENDLFAGQDLYFTQGVSLAFIHPVIRKSPLSRLLISLGKDAVDYYGLVVRQDVFTPTDIRIPGILIGDRPYASYLQLSHQLVSTHPEKKLRLQSSLSLGVLGEEAKAENIQKTIHAATGSSQPEGWHNQIKTDLVLNYELRIEKNIFHLPQWVDLIAFTNIRAGTLYDDAALGFYTRLGRMKPYFSGLPIGKNDKKNPDNRKLYGWLFARASGTLVMYNATLQGGVFNPNNVYTIPAGDVDLIKYRFDAGFCIHRKSFVFEYTQTWISPEFGTGMSHNWGKIGFGFCF